MKCRHIGHLLQQSRGQSRSCQNSGKAGSVVDGYVAVATVLTMAAIHTNMDDGCQVVCLAC